MLRGHSNEQKPNPKEYRTMRIGASAIAGTLIPLFIWRTSGSRDCLRGGLRYPGECESLL